MIDSNNSSAAAGGRPVPAARPAKSAAAFRTISEVANDLDVAQHVLRFWESKFPQVRPLKRGGGRRYYRPEDVELLRTIRSLLYEEGYTIKGAQKLLKGGRRFPDSDAPHQEAEEEDATHHAHGGGDPAAAPAPPPPLTTAMPVNAGNAHLDVAAAARPSEPAAAIRSRLEHLRDELVSLREMLRRAAE